MLDGCCWHKFSWGNSSRKSDCHHSLTVTAGWKWLRLLQKSLMGEVKLGLLLTMTSSFSLRREHSVTVCQIFDVFFLRWLKSKSQNAAGTANFFSFLFQTTQAGRRCQVTEPPDYVRSLRSFKLSWILSNLDFWPLLTAVSPACFLRFETADNWPVLPLRTHIIRCRAVPVGYTSSSSAPMCISPELFMLRCVFNTPSCKSKGCQAQSSQNSSSLQPVPPWLENLWPSPHPWDRSWEESAWALRWNSAPSHFVSFQRQRGDATDSAVWHPSLSDLLGHLEPLAELALQNL